MIEQNSDEQLTQLMCDCLQQLAQNIVRYRKVPAQRACNNVLNFVAALFRLDIYIRPSYQLLNVHYLQLVSVPLYLGMDIPSKNIKYTQVYYYYQLVL